MAARRPNKKELQKVVNAVKRHGGNRTAAAKELDMGASTLKTWLVWAEERGIDVPPVMDPSLQKRATDITGDQIANLWRVFERYSYNINDTAEALDMHVSAVARRVKLAETKYGFTRKSLGNVRAAEAEFVGLPARGKIKRFILTSAQNDTAIHEPTWDALMNLRDYYEADGSCEIKVATFTYMHSQEGSAKRGTKKNADRSRGDDYWYAPELLPFISDSFEMLAPGLVWCGHSNTLPTAVDPLRGAENLNGRASGIFPHTRIEMRPVATMHGDGTKFNYSTGAITLRNYTQKRAGITAEFYHCFGAALVEVNDKGDWWVRQLNADSEGNIYDLDVHATPDGVYANEDGVEAIVFGDIHRANIDEAVMESTWGEGGMVDALRPKKQVFHDLLDFESRSHHNRRDPHEMYRLWAHGRDSVFAEIKQAGEFLDFAARAFSEEFVIPSNHDEHFERWLKEADWRTDLPNAEIYLDAQVAMLAAIRADVPFNALAWAFEHIGVARKARMLDRDESLVVCKESGGGIELGLHGDLGPNGARGSPRTLSKIGRKVVIGHSHSPGIWSGCYVAGVTGKLDQGYNVGPSSWAHAHVVVYPNGKRQVIVFWKGAYRA